MAKILVADGVAEAGLAALRAAAEVDVVAKMGEAELAAAIGAYDGLIVRSATQVTENVIRAARRLAVIGRVGAGVDNIDLEAATRQGIVVVNAPYGNTISVAEHTFGLLLALVRHIPQADAALRAGRWEKKRCEGRQLRGKTLGVLGLGRVGTAVVRRAIAMEMTVLAHDPFVSAARIEQLGAVAVSREELLQRADYVTLHLPDSESTHGLIGERELALMKPGACLINCARGRLVDEGALVAALESGQLGGAALDVFVDEPLPPNHPLLKLEQVVLTPHLAGSTVEAQIDASVEVAHQVLDVIAGRMPHYPVNAPALPAEELAELGPYLDLAQRLGEFGIQFAGDNLKSVEMAGAGQLAVKRMDLMLSSTLVGLLRGAAEEQVNWVNAQWVAQERGIAVGVSHEPPHRTAGWSNLLELHVDGSSGEHLIAGSVLRGEPHIVQVDGYWLDFVAAGSLLVGEHVEQPGILGRMGTLLGEAGVNIHFVQVGRRERGGQGLLVLGLDDPLDESTRQAVLALPSARSAIVVKLQPMQPATEDR